MLAGRLWIVLGAVAGATAVALAALAAHALPQRLDLKALAAIQSAIQMQGWHALALVLTGLWVLRPQTNAALVLGNLAGGGFALGLLLFCGAIYAHHLGGWAPGRMAPVGGVLLMTAWLLLAASALSARPVS